MAQYFKDMRGPATSYYGIGLWLKRQGKNCLGI